MLSFEKAATPPAISTARARMTSGRLVRAKVSKASSITPGPNRLESGWSRRGSTRCRRQGVTQEQRAVCGDKFPGLQSFENLMEAVLLQADFNSAPGEALLVGRDPNRHGAVAFSHHAGERNGRGTHAFAGAYQERSEHSRSQFVLGITDFRAYQEPARIRIDRCPDIDDDPAEQPARISLHIDRHLLSQLEKRKIRLGDVGQHPHSRY